MESDRISVDGKSVRPKSTIAILLNKPAGVVTTRSDELGRRTVYDLIGEPGEWVFPVGRLDKDTTGLLIMTNDHRLGNRLTDPDSRVEKVYHAGLDRRMADDEIAQLESGYALDGIKLRPVGISRLDGTRLKFVLTEGKNRQIRRMCEAFGYRVVSLERVAIGPLKISGLAAGEWRNLTGRELAALSGAGQANGARDKRAGSKRRP